ncbi:hypothetical protein AOG28_08580 [Cobetia sp. UCD-24C]|nr:hypothetical protein AOG28_08580 [Cobetia sp. UCD-24C]
MEGLLTQRQRLHHATFAEGDQSPIADAEGDMVHAGRSCPCGGWKGAGAAIKERMGKAVKPPGKKFMAGNAWLGMHIHDLCQTQHED